MDIGVGERAYGRAHGGFLFLRKFNQNANSRQIVPAISILRERQAMSKIAAATAESALGTFLRIARAERAITFYIKSPKL